ncbi:hypothetical protein [Calycomorphotria hydatis]|uniref:Branched-chain amino acid aminotransferase n=1 Tax=Calycomorphotria hydatis TaxID=2528027 RepID=A0A517T8H7_9PLAN|nr:hypothetical protein [Calycomorphotria hydatis]QDT64659.1 hypothetical protein V22_18990 [Calycomorphotria hydatis]
MLKNAPCDVATQLWNDEAGVIISAELVLVLTIGVIATVVGLNAVSKSVINELKDVSGAIGAVNQSYYVQGFKNVHGNAGAKGFGFSDQSDECDCAFIKMTRPSMKWDSVQGPGSGGSEGSDRGHH